MQKRGSELEISHRTGLHALKDLVHWSKQLGDMRRNWGYMYSSLPLGSHLTHWARRMIFITYTRGSSSEGKSVSGGEGERGRRRRRRRGLGVAVEQTWRWISPFLKSIGCRSFRTRQRAQ